MPNIDIVEIQRSTAVKIADFLKEQLGLLDIELERARTSNAGEMALNVVRNKKATLRALYEELKAAGVEGFDVTIEMLGKRSPFGDK